MIGVPGSFHAHSKLVLVTLGVLKAVEASGKVGSVGVEFHLEFGVGDGEVGVESRGVAEGGGSGRLGAKVANGLPTGSVEIGDVVGVATEPSGTGGGVGLELVGCGPHGALKFFDSRPNDGAVAAVAEAEMRMPGGLRETGYAGRSSHSYHAECKYCFA